MGTQTRNFGSDITQKSSNITRKSKQRKANKKKGGKKNSKKQKQPVDKPEMIAVTVPEGKKAGDELLLEGHSGKFNVTVPEGKKAGDEFHIEIKEANPEPNVVTVKVPQDRKAGDEMIIEGHLGKFNVTVPEGLKAGDEFQTEIKEANPEPNVVTVKVPQDKKAGDEMIIEGHLGKFNVTVPEGLRQ